MDAYLVALYEIKRQSFLLGYIQHPGHFDDALAYAYDKRIAPICHANAPETDPFAEIYVVDHEFAADVIKYIDDKWLAKELDDIGFYKLEDKFGGYKVNRTELIYVIEYARISRLYDDSVYSAIEANAPAEAHNLKAEFSPADVYFR